MLGINVHARHRLRSRFKRWIMLGINVHARKRLHHHTFFALNPSESKWVKLQRCFIWSTDPNLPSSTFPIKGASWRKRKLRWELISPNYIIQNTILKLCCTDIASLTMRPLSGSPRTAPHWAISLSTVRWTFSVVHLLDPPLEILGLGVFLAGRSRPSFGEALQYLQGDGFLVEFGSSSRHRHSLHVVRWDHAARAHGSCCSRLSALQVSIVEILLISSGKLYLIDAMVTTTVVQLHANSMLHASCYRIPSEHTFNIISHILGAAVAYWLGRGIQDRNENFEHEFDSRWWILFRKFEILS